MTSPLDRIFETQQHSIRIAEILGIANQATDTRQEFVNKCLLSTFNLTREQCKHILINHSLLFCNHATSPWEVATPQGDEPFEVRAVKNIWATNMPRLNKEFSKALHIVKFKEKFGDKDPIKAIFEDLNDRFVHGNLSVQRDLKPVLTVIKDHHYFISAGVCQLAWTLKEDEKVYAEKVATAFASRAIPQKGIKFAMLIIAKVGEAPVQIPFTQIQNLRLLLEGSAEELNTGANSRLSETKTVLRELGLADIPPMQHNSVPCFKPGIKEFLNRWIFKI